MGGGDSDDDDSGSKDGGNDGGGNDGGKDGGNGTFEGECECVEVPALPFIDDEDAENNMREILEMK